MENIRELFQILTRRFGLLNKSCCNYNGLDISPVQSHILYEIKRQHLPSMQRIADTIGMDITTFSRQIQTLVSKELVKKSPDSNDRRVYLLSLTLDGEEVERQIDQQMNEYIADIFSHLSEYEKETVIRSIQLLNKAMLQSKSCCLPPL